MEIRVGQIWRWNLDAPKMDWAIRDSFKIIEVEDDVVIILYLKNNISSSNKIDLFKNASIDDNRLVEDLLNEYYAEDDNK